MSEHEDSRLLLEALGFEPDEYVSVCWQPAGTDDFSGKVVAVKDAPAEVARYVGGHSVWIGANGVRKDADRRGKSADVVAVRSVWADLDVAEMGATGKRLATRSDAGAVIDDLSQMLEVEPVAVVDSGHGLQPRWLVKHDPDAFDNADAQAVLTEWKLLVIQTCARHNGTTDKGVFDLARVLRAPGTVNHKDPVAPTSAVYPGGGAVTLGHVRDMVRMYLDTSAPEPPPLGAQTGAGETRGGSGGDPFTGPAESRSNPHVGSIPVGSRDESLRDYARLLRGKGLELEEALALQELRWESCEQLDGNEHPLEKALAQVYTAFEKYAPNQQPGTEKYAADLATEVQRLRIRDEAKEAYAAELAAEHAEDYDALFLDRDALAAVEVPPMLIDGVLPAGANAILRGRDGTYKTFLALDWALHIVTGQPSWHGHAVQQGKVLYIAGEGVYGLSKRIDAWEAEHEVRTPADAFVVRRAALNLHQPGPAFDHLLRFIEAAQFSLVVIDTLRRVSGGADGNGSEMGAVIDNIDRIKVATGEGSTLTPAHTGKDDKDTRGFSGIEDDIDVVWHVDRLNDSSQVVLKHAKMKDAEELKPLTLEAVKVAQSLVLRSALRPDSGPTHEWAILNWFAHGTDAVEVTAAMVIKGTGLERSTVYRWLPKLVEQGSLVRSGKDPRFKYRRA